MAYTYRCESCGSLFGATRKRCHSCGTTGVHTDRDHCVDCGSTYRDSGHQRCPTCGSWDVEECGDRRVRERSSDHLSSPRDL